MPEQQQRPTLLIANLSNEKIRINHCTNPDPINLYPPTDASCTDIKNIYYSTQDKFKLPFLYENQDLTCLCGMTKAIGKCIDPDTYQLTISMLTVDTIVTDEAITILDSTSGVATTATITASEDNLNTASTSITTMLSANGAEFVSLSKCIRDLYTEWVITYIDTTATSFTITDATSDDVVQNTISLYTGNAFIPTLDIREIFEGSNYKGCVSSEWCPADIIGLDKCTLKNLTIVCYNKNICSLTWTEVEKSLNTEHKDEKIVNIQIGLELYCNDLKSDMGGELPPAYIIINYPIKNPFYNHAEAPAAL